MDNNAKSENNISNIVSLQYLTPENAEFSMTENGFLKLKATVQNPEKENLLESIEFERVFLHRAFPFDMPYKYISAFGTFPKLLEKDKEENKQDTSDDTETDKEGGEDKKKEEKKDIEGVTSVG